MAEAPARQRPDRVHVVGCYRSGTTLMMAAAVVSILPILVVFFLAQKYFIQGIALTGVKR